MGTRAQNRAAGPRTFDAPVHGSDEAIAQLRPTYNLGGVVEPSVEELAAMQNAPYVLHARGGKLSRVPAEKTLLPHDPKGHPNGISAAMAADGTIYVSQPTLLSKSTDNGRTWDTREITPEASQNSSFQVLKDGTFVGVRSGVEDTAQVVIWASGDEGATWDRLSEVDNPAGCPVRYANTMCRLPDDTLILPIESRYEWNQDPNYVHRSTDGGKTWGGPTGPYGEPEFVETHWVGPNTGPGFLGAACHESMIAPMASGNLLAVIRYHGPVVPQWPLIDPGQHSLYKTVFLADSHDQGKTWKNLRPLTNVHGQCHGFAAGLSDGSVVVTHDHRYLPGTPGGKAMISRDEGRTWEDEVYHLYFATKPGGMAGFSESVVLEDDTILTLAGATDVGRAKRLSASKTGGSSNDKIGNADAWAIRWRLQ